MLFVDYRDGSKELKEPLRRLGLPVTPASDHDDLPAGDLAFLGRGEKGEGVWIGVEHKRLSDLMQSLRSNRMNEQALKMQKEFRFRYLMIEGDLHVDDQGRFLRRSKRGRFTPMPGLNAAELFKRVFVLHIAFGLVPIWTANQRISLKQIQFLYRVWTDTDMDKHKSHLAIYEPPSIVEPTPFVRTVKTYPECGLKFAKAAQSQFRTIRRATNATAEEWAAIEATDDKGKTRRFGALNAAKIITHVTT